MIRSEQPSQSAANSGSEAAAMPISLLIADEAATIYEAFDGATDSRIDVYAGDPIWPAARPAAYPAHGCETAPRAGR